MIHSKSVGAVVLHGSLLFVLLASALWITGIDLRFLFILILICAIVLPMAFRHMRGRLDLLEPLVMANIALMVMFIGRPLADIASNTTTHLGLDITTTFDGALLVVVVGVISFQLGYHTPFARKFSLKLRKAAVFRPQRAFIAAWVFFFLGGALFALFLKEGGGLGLLFVLLSGKSSEDNDIFLDSSGYLYNGVMFWAASALIFFALATALKQRLNYVWFVAMTLPLLVFFGARGTRSELLPLILSVPIFWYLWKKRRPAAYTIGLVMVVGLALIGWQREIREANSAGRANSLTALEDALSSPLDQATDILNGPDDEMFDSICNELTVVPKQVDFRPFGSLTDIGLRAIPHSLWPDKPLETNDQVVATLWPGHYAVSRGSAAFSILGPFYEDSGFIGLILGMFGLGVLLATIWRWYLRHDESINATLIYSMTLPFVVILMRGTLPGVLTRMLFMVIPLLVINWISRLTVQTTLPAKTRELNRA